MRNKTKKKKNNELQNNQHKFQRYNFELGLHLLMIIVTQNQSLCIIYLFKMRK